MFTDPSLTQVKIVDFGSACTDFRSGFKYVQSRFYRSPEIVVGLPYDNAVDMWSLGCIIYELVTGRPLFPAHHELDLLDLITQRIGPLPDWMTQACSKKRMFFD
jgi:serine/threonine protein kinase